MLGLDPDPARLWPSAAESALGATVAAKAADAVERHCCALIDSAGQSCVAIKPQLACFERLGSAGREALQSVVLHARAAGLIVLADGKRGDIDVSAASYCQSLVGSTKTPYGSVDGLGADAFTVNPYLGTDSIDPYLAACRRHGAGIFCLVRTSNAGARDLQDAVLSNGEPVWRHVAGLVEGWGADLIGERGMSSVGAVVGATVPRLIGDARRAMPQQTILLPGVGAQGATPADVARAFTSGPASALVNASRSVIFAYRDTEDDWRAAAGAEAARLSAEIWAAAGW